MLSLENHDAVDIANWRYGRRLHRRQFHWRSLAAVFVLLGAIGGLAAALGGASAKLSISVAVGIAAWLLAIWRRPPRPWIVVRTSSAKTRIWAWQLYDIRVDTETIAIGVVNHLGQRLHGVEAADFLAGFLSQINGPDCVGVSVHQAVQRVAGAEQTSGRELSEGRGRSGRKRKAAVASTMQSRRPWEIMASSFGRKSLAAIDPELRVALEMAVTEEIEQLQMASRAEELEESVADEKEVAAIADELLLPEAVQRDFSSIKERRNLDQTDPGESR